MSKAWPDLPLAHIAKPISRTVAVVPGQNYRTIGVKWWGEGAYERETIDGSRTSAKSLSLVRRGDLIINKIWVRHGSTAIAGTDVDGCAASGEFPTFELDRERVIPKWIHWQTKTRGFWSKCDALSQGTSGKNRIKPEMFLTIRVPLPPLLEQRRVVARIEALAAQIHEARTLRHQAAEEAEALLTTARRTTILQNGAKNVALEDACAAIIDNLHSNPSLSETGIPCIRSPDVGYGTLDLDCAQRTDEGEFKRRTIRGEPQADDIVLVREGGGTGKCAVVQPGQRFSLGQRVMMLRPNRDRVLPRFFLHQLLSPQIQEEQIAPLSKGSASPHLNIGALRKFNFILPPLPEQRRIVAELDALQAEVDALKRLQAETAAELDALLPSILDRAFKGEL